MVGPRHLKMVLKGLKMIPGEPKVAIENMKLSLYIRF